MPMNAVEKTIEGKLPGLRFGVIGAGAVGSTIAGRLSAAGHDVTLFARNDRLTALRAAGVTIAVADDVATATPRIAEAGASAACDVLFLAVKADALPSLIPAIAAASHGKTRVVPLCNGLPWWYLQRDEQCRRESIPAVDPGGHLAAAIDPRLVIGAIVFLRVRLGLDGIVHSQGSERLILGSAIEGACEIAGRTVDALSGSGIATQLTPEIRRALWTKIALNLATNPLSAVTQATLQDMCADPGLLRIVTAILDETLELAEREGLRPVETVADLVEITRRAGPFLTSMAQDAAAGRPLELAAIADAILDLAERRDCPMPVARTVAALARFTGSR
jgi:2-dehydropantoate 2-reductase